MRWFVAQVARPVGMHVDAKRYLCAREPGYLGRLSDVSRTSLAIQGGPMSDDEADRFERLPGFADALALRRWDEQGKDPDMDTPAIEHFLGIAMGCLKDG
ncbi:MAG: hypothetical protein R3E48_10870 [Burkholderiaceae bacterium]